MKSSDTKHNGAVNKVQKALGDVHNLIVQLAEAHYNNFDLPAQVRQLLIIPRFASSSNIPTARS